jgi:predicted Rossmann fold flavoprotein
LFSLSLADHPLVALAGVAMDPVILELLPSGDGASPRQGRCSQRGPVLITHRGLSGPATLRLTAFAARSLQQQSYRGDLRVDWTGGLSAEVVAGLFADSRQQQVRRQLANARPWPGLSRRLWLHLLERHRIAPELRWADLGRKAEQALISDLRADHYRISGRGPFGDEFVTAGGVALGEVNMATMESRRSPGLHLVGELLDVDGVTGGFNFQHCWSSGWLAGRALSECSRKPRTSADTSPAESSQQSSQPPQS